MASQELLFELLIPTRCYNSCQTNTAVPLGTSPFHQINSYFQTAVSSGAFSVMLDDVFTSMDLFVNSDSPVSASDGELTYRYAIESTRSSDFEWAPSPTPTWSPTDVTDTPTVDIYYPDVTSNTCRTGIEHNVDYNVNRFGSLEDCCDFPWMSNYMECMKKSFNIDMSTQRPTRKPTPPPIRMPTTRRPTKKPSRPTANPTRQLVGTSPNNDPQNVSSCQVFGRRKCEVQGKCTWTGRENNGCISNASNISNASPNNSPAPPPPRTPPVVVYYPDLNLGVCKFDNNHGNTPYQFTTAGECCTNKWMDYEKCMAYANPYHMVKSYYPDLIAGFCRSDGKHESMRDNVVFNSAEACCDNAYMVYSLCTVLSAAFVGSTPNPTETPRNMATPRPSPLSMPVTRKPTPKYIDPSKVTGTFYPESDTLTCLADGNRGGAGPTFGNLAACCTGAFWSAYDDCIKWSLEVYPGTIPGSDNLCMWYPEPDEYGTCVYSELYPDEFWDKRSKFLFDTHGECCQKAFGGSRCKMDYDCEGAQSGPTPMGDVTMGPTTMFPSFGPTGSGPKPTLPPTSNPTRAPQTPRPTRKAQNPTAKPTARRTKRPTKSPVKISDVLDTRGSTSVLADGFENGLSGEFPWQTSGDHEWTIVSGDSAEGTFHARSGGPLTRAQSSDLNLGINSDNGGLIKAMFFSDVRMPFSGSYVLVNGKSIFGYTFAKDDWFEISVQVPAGKSVITFRAWHPNSSVPNIASGVSSTIGLDAVRFYPKK